MSDPREVMVFVDRRDERLLRQSLHALAKVKGLARELGAPLVAVVFGAAGDEAGRPSLVRVAEESVAQGADHALLVEGPALQEARPDVFAAELAALARKRSPRLVALALSDLGRELAARTGRQLEAGVIADADRLLVRDGQVVCECPAWGGEAVAEIYFADPGRPGLVTVSTHGAADAPGRGQPGDVVRLEAASGAAPRGLRLASSAREPEAARRLESAEVVVVGGAGLGSAAGFELVRDLARALSAEVGATRPAALAHWASEERMIGQTGKKVRPRWLISAATSGAAQYTAGILESRAIVAINRDPKARIFEVADLGVVADAKAFLPVLTAKIKRAAFRGLADLLRDPSAADAETARTGLGARARKLRESQGWTVARLAEATGKDPDFIERMEAGEDTPSVSFLLGLAKAFGVDPNAFLTDQEKSAQKDEREKSFATRTQNYSYQTLTPGAANQHLRGFMIVIEPQQAHKPVAYKHEGEEFVHVFEGELELTVGGKLFILKPGESQHFDSEVPHKLRSLSDRPTRCLVMLYTP